jgi:peptidoglycan/xylan/chitin deacetylase (PgdA/CDA1 family)
MMDRRLFLAGLAALPACSEIGLGARPHKKRMAITLDDFQLEFDIGLDKESRHENILNAFDAVGHKAAGFVTGSFVTSDWGRRVVQNWLDRGHLIANHTWSHPHASETETAKYLADIQKNKSYLDELLRQVDFFRFPYLDDGRDRRQQTALFDGLKDLGLRNAPVTVGTVDWFTSNRLEAALKINPNKDLGPYRDYYVEMCVTLANHWDGVAQAVGFQSLPHLTLMHHNILNGHFLKDVLLALKSDGWGFVDAAEALNFSAYHAMPPEPTLGRNWLTLRQRAANVEIDPYPEQYLEFGRKEMDALGL